jgi:hypothetical protein
MNFPNYYHHDSKLNESDVITNIVNAISPKTDLPNDYLTALRSSGNFSNALGFIRTNSGIDESLLEGNSINIAGYFGRT